MHCMNIYKVIKSPWKFSSYTSHLSTLIKCMFLYHLSNIRGLYFFCHISSLNAYIKWIPYNDANSYESVLMHAGRNTIIYGSNFEDISLYLFIVAYLINLNNTWSTIIYEYVIEAYVIFNKEKALQFKKISNH